MQIGELADVTGFPTKTIRYYEQIGLLAAPEREANGYRSYGTDAAQRLHFVQHARSAGLTLREIAQVLAIRSEGRAPCVHVRNLLHHHLEQIDARLAELRAAKRELQGLVRHADSVDPAACPEDVICSILVREQ